MQRSEVGRTTARLDALASEPGETHPAEVDEQVLTGARQDADAGGRVG